MRNIANILPPDIQTLAWIDCGVSKIWKDADLVRRRIHEISCCKLANLNQTVMPGCWSSKYPPYTEIYWRFCGGFFLISVSFLPVFYELFLKVFKRLVEREKVLMWEVNVWAALEYWYPSTIAWYHGDHNESLFCVPDGMLVNINSHE
jgi:hypothetical protein